MVTSTEDPLLSWPELRRVIDEKRCELVIINQQLDKREPSINEAKLQDVAFQEDSPLNFVDFSQVNLTILHPSISRLKQLTNLVLRSNRLKEVPEEIGFLTKLKVVDFSFNDIEKLPDTLNNLSSLSSLNLSNNKISKLPKLSGLMSLQTLDLSHNMLTEFPTDFPKTASKLQTLLLNSNKIANVPEAITSTADQLKNLDLSENEIHELPLPLAFFPKLKVLNLASNRFVDKRFGKLAEDKRHSAPSMVEYLKKKAVTSSQSKKATGSSGDSTVEKTISSGPSLTIRYGLNKFTVTRMDGVVSLRPHIACCLLRNVSLDAENLKTFLSIQNKLHDTVCAHRTLAAIGTHDSSNLSFPLTYTALDPEELEIMPLHKKTLITGRELVAALTAEAEQLRKKQKRNSFSSIHKYLYLVEKLSKYPCTVDAEGRVLSFAPVSEGTREIFVEVSSSETQAVCRSVLDRLIEEIFRNKLSSNLIVEQIKVFQNNGNLLIAYPGKLDLQLSSVSIEREVIKDETSDVQE